MIGQRLCRTERPHISNGRSDDFFKPIRACCTCFSTFPLTCSTSPIVPCVHPMTHVETVRLLIKSVRLSNPSHEHHQFPIEHSTGIVLHFWCLLYSPAFCSFKKNVFTASSLTSHDTSNGAPKQSPTTAPTKAPLNLDSNDVLWTKFLVLIAAAIVLSFPDACSNALKILRDSSDLTYHKSCFVMVNKLRSEILKILIRKIV